MISVDEVKQDYDWKEAFEFGGNIRTATNCDPHPFNYNDLSLVLHADEGMNDGPSWIMVGQLKDGRFFFLEAWCDYTGWDCQAGGDAQVSNSYENLIRYGMTEDARHRLQITLKD